MPDGLCVPQRALYIYTYKTTLRVIRRLEGGGIGTLWGWDLINHLFYRAVYFDHIHRFLSAHVPAPRVQQALLAELRDCTCRGSVKRGKRSRKTCMVVACMWGHPGSANQSVHLFIYLSTVLRSINLSVYLLLFIDLSIYPSFRSVYLFSCFSIYLLIYLFICVTLCLSISLYIRNFLSIYQSVYLSIYLFYLVFFWRRHQATLIEAVKAARGCAQGLKHQWVVTR